MPALTLRVSAAVLGVLAQIAIAAEAPLEWNSLSNEQVASSQDATAEAWFIARNVSITSVEIISVESDCGCVSAMLDRRILHPDESATLIATVDLDPHVGSLDKTVTIRSQARGEQARSTTLRLHVEIPSPLRVEILPASKSDTERFSVNTTVDFPVALSVPAPWADRIALESDSETQRWTVSVSKTRSAEGHSAPYLIVQLPNGRTKRLPLVADSQSSALPSDDPHASDPP